jgi:hypothetical protein
MRVSWYDTTVYVLSLKFAPTANVADLGSGSARPSCRKYKYNLCQRIPDLHLPFENTFVSHFSIATQAQVSRSHSHFFRFLPSSTKIETMSSQPSSLYNQIHATATAFSNSYSSENLHNNISSLSSALTPDCKSYLGLSPCMLWHRTWQHRGPTKSTRTRSARP